MSKAWELYLPEVLVDVPGCPDIVAVNAVRNAAIDFCEKSQVWQYDFTAKVSLVAAQAVYALTPPTGARVNMVTYLGFLAPGATMASVIALIQGKMP